MNLSRNFHVHQLFTLQLVYNEGEEEPYKWKTTHLYITIC
jgi:hypothetical protein